MDKDYVGVYAQDVEEVQPEAEVKEEEEAPATPEVNLDDLVKSMKSYTPIR